MKRFCSALAMLFACAGLAPAHYVIIRLNLGAPPPKAELKVAPPVGPGGLPAQPLFAIKQPKINPVPPPPPAGSVSVIVLLEYKSQKNVTDPNNGQVRPDLISIDHNWGKTMLAFDQQAVQTFPLWDDGLKGRKVGRPTVSQVFEVRYKNMLFEKGVTATHFLDLAEWSLANGLEAKVPEIMKQAADRNQAEPDPRVAKSVEAFDKVVKQMSQPPTRDETYLGTKSVEGLKVAKSDHYTVYYDAPSGSGTEVDARLKKLEQNYRTFYWWFALRGKALPLPERRLTALLIDRSTDFRQYYMSYGAPGMNADSYYSQRENLAVISSLPLELSYDLASLRFRDLAQKGWDLRAMLNPKLQWPRGKAVEDICHAQTMALLQKALHEESELASVSQAGTRQLLTASGLLPRSVSLPDWIQAGLVSFFETPKFNHETQTGAFWVTCGLPHWVYLPMWRDLEARKSLEAPEDAIKGVITDGYFRLARSDFKEQLRAKTMAWSLTYFLANRRLDQLLAYCRELGNLPRDLELDEDAYLGCFARAFGVAGADGRIDDAKLGDLAQEWFKYIAIAPMPEVSQDAQKALADMKKKDGKDAKK